MKVVIVTNGNDWEGLYINGVLVTEGHKVTSRDLVEAMAERLPRLNISFDEGVCDNNWLYKKGNLPDNLEKVIYE